MRIARDAFLRIRKVFECKEWKKYCSNEGIAPSRLRVANTIIKDFRQGMGLSDKPEDIKLHRPLPWNYFDMTSLSVIEFSHNRILGILSSIIAVIENLIPFWHTDNLLSFWKDPTVGDGIQNNIVFRSNKEGGRRTSGKSSRKAMKVWNAALLYLLDGQMWGIHKDIIEVLRIHMMCASRFFSPGHCVEQHFVIRSYLLSSFLFYLSRAIHVLDGIMFSVSLEKKLKTWRLSSNENEQTKLLADTLWATDNAKNIVPGFDLFTGPWGHPRSEFSLKFESFHRVLLYSTH